MNPFSIKNIALQVLGYNMSWVELFATIFTVACVWLAAMKHILNWPVAMVAIVLSFFVFYQSSLYADSFLQLYFFATSIYGWWFWSRKNSITQEQAVTVLTVPEKTFLVVVILVFTIITSFIMQHINGWMPEYFPQPAAFPFPDSFIMVASIAGQWLLAKKKLENWYCWIAVNTTAIFVYFLKDLKLFSLLYLVLLGMAVMGIVKWRNETIKQ